jgi:hypothetical protein
MLRAVLLDSAHLVRRQFGNLLLRHSREAGHGSNGEHDDKQEAGEYQVHICNRCDGSTRLYDCWEKHERGADIISERASALTTKD